MTRQQLEGLMRHELALTARVTAESMKTGDTSPLAPQLERSLSRLLAAGDQYASYALAQARDTRGRPEGPERPRVRAYMRDHAL